MVKKGLCLVLGVLFLSSLIFINAATFEVGNLSHKVDISYAPGDNVRGWVNLSLNDALGTVVLTDALGNSIDLVDLLKANHELEDYFYDYSCIPADCETGYTSNNGETEKKLTLDEGEIKIIGFKLEGEISNIDSVIFDIESNATPSCSSQIKLDFFVDNSVEKINTKMSNLDCLEFKRKGCFNEAKTAREYEILDSPPSCQRITLSESPGFRLGAWIKEVTPGDKEIKMELYDIEAGQFLESSLCEIDTNQITPEGGEAYCEIEYPVKKTKDYYVCIFSDDGLGSYKIRGYADSVDGCGFHEDPSPWETENAAYDIFAQGMKFSAVGNLTIENENEDGTNLGDMFEQYIQNKYGGLGNCEGGCIVPIEIYSGQAQRIVLKNLLINYSDGIGQTEETRFYTLADTPSKVKSEGMQKLYLNLGNFTLSNSYADINYWLKLNDEILFTETLKIESVPVILGLSPSTTFSAFPTPFEILISNSSKTIKNYFWEFGDGEDQITTTNLVTHTYNATGRYELKLTVTDSDEKSSYKTFSVSVGSPEEVINSTLAKLKSNLIRTKTQILNFSEFEQKQLNLVLDIEEKNNELKQLEREFLVAEGEEFNEIMTRVLELNIPESISEVEKVNPLSFVPSKEEIKLDILTGITDEEYDLTDAEAYKEAIISWNKENLDTKVSLSKINAKYEGGSEYLISFWKIAIEVVDELREDPYFVIEDLEDIEFKEDYGEEKSSTHHHSQLRSLPTNIYFSSTEDVSFSELPAFISPEISRLSIVRGAGSSTEKGEINWLLLVLILFLVLIIGLVIYIFLQEWYRKNYEDHLFKDKNALYNLITYVQNTTRKGTPNEEMERRLGKARWSSEQIKYIMKKYAGKRTGMWEIPVKKLLDKMGKNQSVPQKINAPGQPRRLR
jgi:PKD repeat protein